MSVFCTYRSDLNRIALDLTGPSRIALDIETYGERKSDGLDPWTGGIRLPILCRHGGTILIIDLRAIGYELGPLRPILEEAGIIAHNAKFDLLWLRVKCGLIALHVHCTLTAARLLVSPQRSTPAYVPPGPKNESPYQRLLTRPNTFAQLAAGKQKTT
jgi:ribonuclease D